MKRFSGVVWAVAMVAMGGCTTTQGGSGGEGSTTAATSVSGAGGRGGAETSATTGQGGMSGSGGTGGSSSTGTTNSASSSASSSTGGDPCDPTYTCAEALDGDPTKVCDGKHGDLYDTYYACTCEPGGKCEPACGDNACMDGVYSAECTACLKSSAMGCAKEYGACADDI